MKTCRRSRLFLFMAMVAVTAACGSLLGDFPEGQLSPDGSTDAGPDGANVSLSDGPPGSICVAPHATVIDFAVDDSSIYWLQNEPERPGTFSLIQCRSGQNTPLATIPEKPEALEVSDQFIFWTVNRKADAGLGGGVWRMSKAGGEPRVPWRNYVEAGPLAFVNGSLFMATHDGSLYAADPNESSQSRGLAGGQAEPLGITASTDVAYWFNRSQILKVASAGGGTVILLIDYGDGTQVSSLSMGSHGFYWATRGTTRSLRFQCDAPVGCSPQDLAKPSTDIAGIAAYGDEIYWTTNEPPKGIVRSCRDPSCPSLVEPMGVEVGRIRADASYVYFQAKGGDNTFIVQHTK